MKKFLFGAMIIGLVSCDSKTESPFTVQGTLRNTNAKIIYLEQNRANSERPTVVDSSQVGADGSYSLKAVSNEENLYSLRAGEGMYPFAILINDSKKIRVDADLSKQTDTYQVSGSPASEAIINFDKTIGEKTQQMNALMQHYGSLIKLKPSDSLPYEKIQSLKAEDSTNFMATFQQLKDQARQQMENSKSPMFVIYAFEMFQSRAEEMQLQGFTQTDASDIVNKSLSKFPNHTALLDWKKRLRPSKAPEFTVLDTSRNNAITLASFKGKYVLVDFWASWCDPCRKENPNVVAAYNQFRDKNFTILGVSLDQDKNAWVKAIHDDGLNWNHGSELKKWENSDVANMYGVQQIPANFLIDPDGNIVAENLHGQELFKTLDKLLK
jgi:peroxiredoxin